MDQEQNKKKQGFLLRLPVSLREQATKIAHEDGISLNHFISLAVTEKISRMAASTSLDMPRMASPNNHLPMLVRGQRLSRFSWSWLFRAFVLLGSQTWPPVHPAGQLPVIVGPHDPFCLSRSLRTEYLRSLENARYSQEEHLWLLEFRAGWSFGEAQPQLEIAETLSVLLSNSILLQSNIFSGRNGVDLYIFLAAHFRMFYAISKAFRSFAFASADISASGKKFVSWPQPSAESFNQ
jgi:hypothetical protein